MSQKQPAAEAIGGIAAMFPACFAANPRALHKPLKVAEAFLAMTGSGAGLKARAISNRITHK
jgi:hypothetical protein